MRSFAWAICLISAAVSVIGSPLTPIIEGRANIQKNSSEVITVRISDFLKSDSDDSIMAAVQTIKVNRTSDQEVDMTPFIRKVFQQTELQVDLSKCRQVETLLFNQTTATASNAPEQTWSEKSEDMMQMFVNGKQVTQQLFECQSGWSSFNLFASENCVLSMHERNITVVADVLDQCYSAHMEDSKQLLASYKLSVLVLQEYFNQVKSTNAGEGCQLSQAEVDAFATEADRVMTDYASYNFNTTQSDFQQQMQSLINSLKCIRQSEFEETDGTELQKRAILPALLPIVPIVFFTFWASVLAVVTFAIATPSLKHSFKAMSNQNREIAKNIKLLSPGCDGELYWGSCGIPGTDAARECPGGGHAVFSGSCASFHGYQPGSVLCPTGSDADISKSDDEVRVPSDSSDGETHRRSWSDIKQSIKYGMLGFSRFKCQSLCVKPNNPQSCNNS